MRRAFAPLALGVALTALYTVHADLPKIVRAPSSWLLAPVASVDGLCYALGVPGIYGKLVPIFLVNLSASVVAVEALAGGAPDADEPSAAGRVLPRVV